MQHSPIQHVSRSPPSDDWSRKKELGVEIRSEPFYDCVAFQNRGATPPGLDRLGKLNFGRKRIGRTRDIKVQKKGGLQGLADAPQDRSTSDSGNEGPVGEIKAHV